VSFDSRVRIRIRVTIRFSVQLINGYLHVIVLLQIVIVKLLKLRTKLFPRYAKLSYFHSIDGNNYTFRDGMAQGRGTARKSECRLVLQLDMWSLPLIWHLRHMQFLTPAPNFRGRVSWSCDPAFSSPWISTGSRKSRGYPIYFKKLRRHIHLSTMVRRFTCVILDAYMQTTILLTQAEKLARWQTITDKPPPRSKLAPSSSSLYRV